MITDKEEEEKEEKEKEEKEEKEGKFKRFFIFKEKNSINNKVQLHQNIN